MLNHQQEEILLFEDAIDDLIPYFPSNHTEGDNLHQIGLEASTNSKRNIARGSPANSVKTFELHSRHCSARCALQQDDVGTFAAEQVPPSSVLSLFRRVNES